MDWTRAEDILTRRCGPPLVTIDSHTAGEPTRLLVDGAGEIPGATMEEKRLYFMDHLDPVRLRLAREPRGHRDMVVAVVTPPVSPGAAFGLIYMDARRYPYLCGHATIGAVTTLIEAGVIQGDEPETQVVVDTPSGPMEARAALREGRVASVAIRAVPSFVQGADHTLDIPGLGPIRVSMVCVGGVFAMVSADQLKIPLTPEHSARLIDLGMTVIEFANQQIEVHHPTRPEVTTVDVAEFYEEDTEGPFRGRSVVIYGERHMDRSPCGTGTTAKLTLLHHQGRIQPGRTYVNRSPLGTTFEARIVQETRVGDVPAVIVEIRGSAHVTGMHTFLVDPEDPFPGGFLI